MTEWRQLPLPFVHAPSYDAASFIAAPSNAQALAWLGRVAEWPSRRLALWGVPGGGKTHLLQVWAARHKAVVIDAAALTLPEAPPDTPATLDMADGAPEIPLLHLLNAMAEAGQPLLLAAREPPARWPVALPDLVSRLRATAAVELRAPDDELLRLLLSSVLADRQLAVPEPVQSWLLMRLPRSPDAMREAAARLDRAALRTGTPVTRGLAAAVVAEMED